MSKEEFMKIQTCVLKVNIHCDGCKHKVKKILQKIDGVFTTSIDAEQGKVTVSGNVDAKDLIKKLQKKGKHAELWGGQKANNNQGNVVNQFKNMQLDNGKGGNNNNKGQKGGNNNNNQPKSGGGGGQPNPQQLQQQQLQQQLQQLQQMKGFQDLKLPPGAFKDMKMPPMKDQNQKTVKFSPEDEEFSDDLDEEYDDDEFDDDDYDDEFDEPNHPLNKKPIMGNVPQQGIPHNIMMMNGNNPQFMNAQRAAQIQNAAQNAKKGGAVPVQVNTGNNGNGGKKGGGNNGGNNQNQGGKNGKNGGGLPHDGKNGGGGGGGGAHSKTGNNGGGANANNINGNGGKKGNNGGGGGMGTINDGFQHMDGPHGLPNVKLGQMSSLPMGHQMGNMSMGQMGNIPAVQGLPAAAMGGGAAAGGGAGYFQGAGPDPMPGNPYHQQQQQHQYMAAVMNHQRAMGNERFQPMMYARQPAAVNYAPQQPYPYAYPPHPHPYGPQDPSYSFFSDENTSSCNVM